jgi:hypothetical protein
MQLLIRGAKLMINSIVKELSDTATKLNIQLEILPQDFSADFIQSVLKKYTPANTTNHLAVGNNCKELPLETFEFTYSESLQQEPGYLFFEQIGLGTKTLLKIENITETCKLFENSFGIEYFLTNKTLDFLISVNWYVLQCAMDNGQ